MKRDMDLVREILLGIEGRGDLDGKRGFRVDDPAELGLGEYDLAEIAYHLTLLIEADLVQGSTSTSMPTISRLTWQGHEFIDDVRDPAVWRKTKAGAKAAGNLGVQFMWQLAKAYGKQVAKERLGLDIG